MVTPEKHSKTKRPDYKMSGDMTSQIKKVPNTKRPKLQNAKLRNAPNYEMPQTTKCPKLLNAPNYKRSQIRFVAWDVFVGAFFYWDVLSPKVL